MHVITQLPRAPPGQSEEKRKAKTAGGEEGIFFLYLPKSTLAGFTGLDNMFSLLSCRVSSWDSLLVSSRRILNQMRRIPWFFSPIQNALKNEECRVFKRGLRLSKPLDLGGGEGQ